MLTSCIISVIDTDEASLADLMIPASNSTTSPVLLIPLKRY
jgi:hypothetical protein